jgi:hypothetical protein
MLLTCLPRDDIYEPVFQIVEPQIVETMHKILEILETDKPRFNWVVAKWFTM